MADPQEVLAQGVRAAITAAFGASHSGAAPLIRPSAFADFQSNAALPLGKALRRPPREVAADLVDSLELAGVCEKVEISGPGFINFTLSETWIGSQVTLQLADPRLGAPTADPAVTAVVDYSGPNVAKELHVGHLRATVVGDAVVRILEFLGQRVV